MRRPDWTVEEENYLQDAWGVISIGSIAKKINRSVDAVVVRSQRLGLGAFLDAGDYIPVNQIFTAMGISGGYVMKTWLASGLPVKYQKVKNCRFKVINLEEFWIWAEKNRQLINWVRLEENILGKEPGWVKEQRRVTYQKKSFYLTLPWSSLDDSRLQKLLKEFKYSYRELSQRLRRTEGAIQRRILDLGLKERPLKADNHIAWTDAEYAQLAEMLKARLPYEFMSEKIGKSVKAIRGRVYSMYLTENIDKAAAIIGRGSWGDNRPARPITHLTLNTGERQEVKSLVSRFAGILRAQIRHVYDTEDYWQKDICMKWDGHCTAGETNCDACFAFVRIQPQYCVRCGAEFIERKTNKVCVKCRAARKKQHQRKWLIMAGRKSEGDYVN